MFECKSCKLSFSRKDNLNRHYKSICKTELFKHDKKDGQKFCFSCKKGVKKNQWSYHIRTNEHKQHSCKPTLEDRIKTISSAFKERIISYQVSPKQNFMTVKEFFDDLLPNTAYLILSEVEKHTCIKANFELFAIYLNPKDDTRHIKSFNTPYRVICASSNLTQEIDEMFRVIDRKVDDLAERDSGWTLIKFIHLEININKFNPLKASSFIPLPNEIAKKKAIININNNDDFCFAWSVMAALFPPTGMVNEISSYPHYSEHLDLTNINFPIVLKDIPKFERQNNISINVYSLETFKSQTGTKHEIVGPLHYTKIKSDKHVNLLLIGDGNGNFHYCYISDLSRLISSQVSNHHGKKYLCDGCLQYFSSNELLVRHNAFDCDFVRIKLPTKDLEKDKFGNLVPNNILKFQNFQKQIELPFVIYADFECVLKPVDNTEENNENPHESYTIKKYEHIPYSFAYYVKCSFDDKISKFETFTGPNCDKVFINYLERDVLNIYNKYLKYPKKMKNLTTLEKLNYNYNNICHICDKEIINPDDKVADHCHVTGQFRGPAHSNCNLNYKNSNFLPVIFHNLRNYDCHLFIKNLCEKNESLSVIAQNKEKYISFEKSIHVDTYLDKKTEKLKKKFLKLRFIDSFQFLPYSLSKLSDSLEDTQCIEVRKEFADDEKFRYIRQKGVFPYKYIDDFLKLYETKLPSKENFYNDLTNEHINDEEYQRAINVWKIFNCETISDYSNIYLKSDVLLLADIFENFRRTCLDNYKLDPAWYYSFPHLSFDACLRYTGVELELLTDTDMLHFFKDNVRGGVSTCITRKSVANNKFLSNYDISKPNKYIMYLDATNLYGFSMSQHLPQKDFVWLSENEINNLDILNISDTSEKGYVLEVDLEYPTNLHDLHNEYPFCPQNFKPKGSNTSKLIPNLENKQKYVLHYTSLKQCLKYGLKLTKIYRVLQFTQSPWLKKYVDLNTKLRNESKNIFQKNTFKLSNNSIYGKTMENVERRCDIRLATQWEKNQNKDGAENLIAKPHFKDRVIFSDNLTAIQMQKVLVEYNKPIYAGFSILDISKNVMYEFFYGFLKPLFGEKVKLLYTDTDSFILEIETDNIYENMKNHIDMFDTSNYKEKNSHNMPKTKSVIGKFKDEYAGEPIQCFYGTGAKAYCIKTENKLDKKAKGISKHSIKNQLDFIHYKDVVENDAKTFCTMYVFRSHMHNIYTEQLNKLALTSSDDKRYKLPDSYDTLAWGHNDILLYNWLEEHDA